MRAVNEVFLFVTKINELKEMAIACVIELQNNNDNNQFYAGQELCGTVRLTLAERIHLRGVYIQIKGKGFWHWESGRNHYTDQVKYLNEKLFFIGSESGKCIFILYMS